MTDRIDQYEIREELSRSSTTTVYKAYQKTLERFVLLKQLHPHLTREEDIVRRFQREAKASARIKHEHIVDVYDYGQWEDAYYIAMEFVDGTSLKAVIDRDGPLPIDIATTVLRDALKGLAHAHAKGVFHRDIKPANILISTEGVVKITDFGLALISDHPSITAQDGVVGTPAYMSPEQASGEQIDGRSDIFSLGLTYFEMLTGRRVYDGESFSACITKLLTEDPPKIRDVRQDVPVDLAELLDKMVLKSISKRYQTCQDIVQDIHHFSSVPELLVNKGEVAAYIRSPRTRPLPVTSPGTKRGPSKARFAVVGISLISLLILIAGGFILFPRGSQDTGEEPLAFNVSDSEGPSQHGHTDTTDTVSSGAPTHPEETSYTNQEKQPGQRETTPPPVRTQPDVKDPHDGEQKRSETPPISVQPEETGYGTLEINCLPWAEVYIDDQYIDTTPLGDDISLEAGSHTIAFVNPEFPPYFETVVIEPNQSKHIEVSLFTNVGFLDVNVHPWAAIFMDGDSVDTTPLVQPIMLSAGTHSLRLENPRYGVFEEKVAIAARETLRVNRNLIDLHVD